MNKKISAHNSSRTDRISLAHAGMLFKKMNLHVYEDAAGHACASFILSV